MSLPSITDVAWHWAGRCLKCDAPSYSCNPCWERAASDNDGSRRPDCLHACRDWSHSRYQAFCDPGEPECLACGKFLGVTPAVWGELIADGHDPTDSSGLYGPGDIRFMGRLLVMSEDEASVENTAPFCWRCWNYLRPRALPLEWLCQLRDRKDSMLRPETIFQWVPQEVREFYERWDGRTEAGSRLDDPAWRAEWERISRIAMEAFHESLCMPFSVVPGPSRYVSDRVKEEVFERDGGQCVKCGSTRSLQFDHLIPHSRGGATNSANLQILCEDCNRNKGNRYVS